MPFFIFFLMISWPVLEVASIIQVSKWVGPLTTFLLLAAGFAFGAFLIRTQGRVVGMRVMEAMRTGAAPEKTLLDSGTVSLAGVLFMIPGFVSDAVAVLLLIPAVRSYMWRGVSYGFQGRARPAPGPQPRPEPGFKQPPKKPKRAEDVIDVEFTEVPRDQNGGASNAKRADSPWGKPQ
ncbi:MAG: FxsA family protein [Rhodomicrobium sp.]|jgi:UPF0716 protein FxsA